MIDIENVLEILNVTKKFGKKTVIDNVSFNVKEGEILGFLGPNGAGKTTVIKMIMGLLKITNGEIRVCTHNIADSYENAAQNFGGIIENPEVYLDLTGMQNIYVFNKLYDNITKERIDYVIKLVGLEKRINEKVKNYSLGMRQRLGIAIAIMHNPKLLILDEPTNGLDPEGIKDLRDILKKFARNGAAVLVSSHLLSEMELMCDNVCIIDKGKIVEIKKLNAIKNSDDTENTYIIDCSNKERAYEIAIENSYNSKIENNTIQVTCFKESISKFNKLLIEENIDVYTVSIKTKSLEDEFIETTSKKRGNI